MSSSDAVIVRRADGSIDLEHYTRRSALLHRQALAGHRDWLAAFSRSWLRTLRAALRRHPPACRLPQRGCRTMRR